MQKKWHYVYVILYPSLGYKFYYGSRITENSPEEDTDYFGSSVTFSRYNDSAHDEYQQDALKVVLYSFYGKSGVYNAKKISGVEQRLIKEAVSASHVGPEICLNRNVSGRIFGTPDELKTWRSLGGKKGGGKNAKMLGIKLAKEFAFFDPEGRVRTIRGLRPFCRENNLDPSAMRHVQRGRRTSHKGWRKYE